MHGVAPKAEPGRVDVTGRVDGERLLLDVCDDGPGIAANGARKKEGVGLANTRERLLKTYGARASLTLSSEPGCGVRVQIVLPFRT